jgi:UDP-N-acetylmuramate dehydrogenase
MIFIVKIITFQLYIIYDIIANMSFSPIEHINTSKYSTFRMGASVKYYIPIESLDDIKPAIQFTIEKSTSFRVLGEGSNTIFKSEGEIDLALLHMKIYGFEILEENESYVLVKIGAGENWDSIVEKVCSTGLSGIEAMSKIPGTVGATPVQNVGAYGQEIKDTLVSVNVYDAYEKKFVELSNSDCTFGYRDSVFKNKAKGRYIITHVTLKLSKSQPSVPNYPGVKTYFENKGITNPTLLEIREAIISIRANKLPDPKDVASVGSFFKNPIVSNQIALEIKEKYPNAVVFPINENESKIGAGWLIDTLGLKGKEFGNLMLYPNNALVIVNKGGATYEELANLVYNIQEQVKNTFGIQIEPEPEIVL